MFQNRGVAKALINELLGMGVNNPYAMWAMGSKHRTSCPNLQEIPNLLTLGSFVDYDQCGVETSNLEMFVPRLLISGHMNVISEVHKYLTVKRESLITKYRQFPKPIAFLYR